MVDPLKLTSLRFKRGPGPNSPPLEITPGDLTIVVGPNNSGKSTALREIEGWAKAQSRETPGPMKVLSAARYQMPRDQAEALALVEPLDCSTSANNEGGTVQLSWHQLVGRDPQSITFRKEELAGCIQAEQEGQIRHYILGPLTVRLDGRTRFSLVEPQERDNLLDTRPRSSLWSLYVDDAARKKVQEIIKDAFGYYLVVDNSSPQFRIKFGKTSLAPDLQRSLSDEALSYFRQAAPIEEFGDGVQAFTGLVAGLASLPHRLILLDEPEAYLHPTLAKRLGSHLVKLARERKGNVIASTHSAEFLMGCLENSDSISLVRLTYNGSVATAASLPATEVKAMMRSPLLRSASTLRALFYSAVVVTEADSDRAFYSEINNRLQAIGKGFADALFLNAQNFQTIERIVKPLRAIGIPTIAVMDFDAIDRDNEWRKIYESLYLAPAERDSLESLRAAAKAILAGITQGREYWKLHGVNSTSDASKKSILQSLVTDLRKYGLFLVPCGQLESWLPGLGVSGGDKKTWITGMFEKMGSDPADRGYVTASTDDVWEFVNGMVDWASQATRRGMP